MCAAMHFRSGAPAQKQFACAYGCLAALFLLTALQSAARPPQHASQQPAKIEQDTIRVNVELVVLHATVQNRRRAFVPGLGKENFHVYENGVLQRIESFSHEDVPVTVGLVVDNSGSMAQKHRDVIAAALAFERSSHPDDQMFVVHFNENVWFGLPVQKPFTDKEADLQAALAIIKADGMTALYDAMGGALEHLKNGKWDKKVLIVISDGADNASKRTLDEILTLAKQSGVIIYTVGLFQPEDPDRNPGVLKELARATGGEAFLPELLKQVTPICERIARDIRNQYTLSYVPVNSKQDGAYRTIEVRAGAPGHGRLTVRTRAGYYPRLRPASSPAAQNLP
jgi:Ca-activated chloride channel family protein